MIYIGIILTIIAIALSGVVFFLFAMWRALLGKSSVDLKLATTIDIQTKRIESLNKSMDKYDTTSSNMSSELREIKQLLKEAISKHNEEKS